MTHKNQNNMTLNTILQHWLQIKLFSLINKFLFQHFFYAWRGVSFIHIKLQNLSAFYFRIFRILEMLMNSITVTYLLITD